MKIKAAVIRKAGGPSQIESLTLDEPRADEVLVRIVASGMCHTDHEAAHGNMPPSAPAVFGHEGAGVVEKTGSHVTHVVPGDHVVISYPSCGQCAACSESKTWECEQVVALALSGARPDGSCTLRDDQGNEVHGVFFGQSSFASHVLAFARNTVKVPKEAPLELLSMLGCGVMTGTGTVLNIIEPRPGSSIAIFGAGAVGLAAVMAAKIAGCAEIIVVDRVHSRLALATELGATRSIDGTTADPRAEILAMGGVDATVEASGNKGLIETAISVVKPHGAVGLIGVTPPGTHISFDQGQLMLGRRILSCIMGHANPQTFIPKLIDYYLQDKLPIDKLAKRYSLLEINSAYRDSASGATIKPILVPDPEWSPLGVTWI